ncbi:hypothetical protein [Poseidonocella sp. HB161398]|uniref:hypothetical protein n=1 Tax=Poseidonocella sp. HB161398 TaxID=2320855 RepID=UPI0011092346|nr:hypothetical protein [Poseidonocella sp. HB161398]
MIEIVEEGGRFVVRDREQATGVPVTVRFGPEAEAREFAALWQDWIRTERARRAGLDPAA